MKNMESDIPPKEPSKIEGWVRAYLQHHMAQQFTINGFTYPFVRELNFASLPYPIDRKYSMLAGLFITRPGDLLFMFQSDPQWPDGNINSRRGLRGVYRVASEPFADSQPISMSSTGYTMLGECPACHTFHASLSSECIECNAPYPSFPIPPPLKGRPYRLLNMHLRLELEPLIVFERAVSDEKAYGDMSDPQMIWIGRHDNQMGIGKGSSIRQLLPEEAAKIVRLSLNEPGQILSYPTKVPYPNRHTPILSKGGTPAEHLLVYLRPKAGDELDNELMLNFDISRKIDKKGSSIQKALGKFFTQGDLEYFSTEFPWGYTASTSDFVCTFAKNGLRYRIIIMEFKKDWAGDDTAIQVSLYVPWVVQVLTQFANPEVKEIQVVPVFIGKRLEEGTCIPKPYDYKPRFLSGVSPATHVESPIYIEYKPTGIYKQGGDPYAQDIEYLNKSDQLRGRLIDWRPPLGTATSQIERDWVKDNSWVPARRAGGF